ncbi:acyl-CoA dehydrogenase [Alkalimarinus alittae]|uniref:Acyl-coenzyme A dehydrogenase n=1 Tax=Alkalimarinus alittae TaxID=2961619 RepID=A0ABY6N2I3_9ALTE|nr:acyl-CoA dehydrogenase [Alkalimarinus alittae]UZE96326.1 acyl-CoA dehydrogenase [Alkalimarinus alittae]
MLVLVMFLLIVIGAAFYGIGPVGWSAFFGLSLVYYSFFTSPSLICLLLLWPLFIGLVLFLNFTALRRQYISTPIAKWARDVLPEISDTEREALEAGTVSWDGELFSGNPDWRKLHELKKPVLTQEEQAFIDGPVETLCEMLDDWEITYQRYDLSPETWQFLKDHGFFGIIIPKQYGGLEMSALAHSTAVMKIATRSITAAVTVMVPNSLGPAELLLMYGTQSQRDDYLPKLAKGEEIPCFALTGPKAGSDAGAMPDKGIICKGEWEGKEVIGLRLSWNKRYITLAPVATVLGLAFKTYDPDHLLGEQASLGVTCALVPTSTPGVHIGDRHLPLNMVFMNGPTWGEDVFIPMDYLIGGEENIGKGWSMLMNCLSVGRSISLPALSTGAGKLSCLTTGAYSRIREQFNTPIGYFEGVEEALAQIGGLSYLMDSARTLTTSLVDQGEKPSVPSAILKYHNTENMRQVVSHAMDVHAGRGVIKGPRNYIARVYQAVPISITVEGANILTRSMMIFGQGSIRCHPFLLKEMDALHNPDTNQGLVDFDKALFCHIGHSTQMVVRSLVLGLTHSRLASTPAGISYGQHYYRHLSRLSAAFAVVSDFTLMLLGGELKRREKISARLGDCLSQLYYGSAALKRFADDGCPEEDQPLLDWAMQHSIYQLQDALIAVLNNYPSKPVAVLLRGIVFPLGRRYKKPNDALEHKIAQLLMNPSKARDRLVEGVYRNTRPDDPIGRVENAFLKKLANKEIDQKIKQAVKSGQLEHSDDLEVFAKRALELDVLSEQEATLFREAEEAVNDAIQVDAFAADELPGFQSD